MSNGTTLIQTLHPLTVKGTQLPVGGRSYQFTRNHRGDYVAEVLNVDVDRILSISAGYQVYDHQDDVQVPGDEITAGTVQRHVAPRAQPQSPTPRGFGRKTSVASKTSFEAS